MYNFVSKLDLMESNIHLYDYVREVAGDDWHRTTIGQVNQFLNEVREFFEEKQNG